MVLVPGIVPMVMALPLVDHLIKSALRARMCGSQPVVGRSGWIRDDRVAVRRSGWPRDDRAIGSVRRIGSVRQSVQADRFTGHRSPAAGAFLATDGALEGGIWVPRRA